jgi:hypothetical protein
MLNRSTGFPIREFLSRVYLKAVFVVLPCAASVPILFEKIKPSGVYGMLASVAVCVIWAAALIYIIGMDRDERNMVRGLLTKRRGQ